MNVQELFRQADAERVAEAYFLQHTIFYPYEQYTLDEKIDSTVRIKEQIREYVKRLATCDIKIEEPHTIFIIEYLCDSYEDKGKKELYLFLINDNEAMEKSHGDFSAWNDEDGQHIDCYDIDMCKVEELAGYSIAEECVKAVGVTACCAEILYELFWFGYTDENREKNIQEFYKSIDEAEKEIEEGKTETYISAEEMFDKFWQERLDECEEDDERQHMILKKEYDNKVRDIEARYSYKIHEENHKKAVEIIRNEYLSRGCSVI